MSRRAVALASLMALAACGKSDNDPGPGGVTVGEARALDEAAEMIDQKRLSAEALQPSAAPAPAVNPAEPSPARP